MTKEQAKEIVEELYNESAYNLDVIPYCGEFLVRISEKQMFEHHMYINPKIVELLHKRGLGVSVQNEGEWQKYMRIVLM